MDLDWQIYLAFNPYHAPAKKKKKSVFWVTGLKILGRVGTKFFLFFFLEKI